MPPSLEEWLPEDHLARFVVETVETLDTTALEEAYDRRGSEAYHPKMLLALLFYGYATGTFSSRKIEEATYDSVAFRYVPISIRITIRFARFADASWRSWRGFLSRSWKWPLRWVFWR
jgi:hypothetical protein